MDESEQQSAGRLDGKSIELLCALLAALGPVDGPIYGIGHCVRLYAVA